MKPKNKRVPKPAPHRIAWKASEGHYTRTIIMPHHVTIMRGEHGSIVRRFTNVERYVSVRRVARREMSPEQLAQYVETAVWVSTLRDRPTIEAHDNATVWTHWVLRAMGWDNPEHWLRTPATVHRSYTARVAWSLRAHARMRAMHRQLIPALRDTWNAPTHRIIRYVRIAPIAAPELVTIR